MTPDERAVFQRRRRRRKSPSCGVLVALVVLFYFISMARVLRG